MDAVIQQAPAAVRPTLADAATSSFVDALNHIVLIGAGTAFVVGVLCLVLIRQQDFVQSRVRPPRGRSPKAPPWADRGAYAPPMNPMRSVAVKLGGQPWLPRYSRLIVGSDKMLQRVTRGRVTIMSATGLPELVLQVPGRKSGVLRTTPLLCVPHEGGWLVVGSNWGAPEPPAWAANLRAAEEPLVTFKGRTVATVARELHGARARGEVGGAGRTAGPTTRRTPSAPTACSRSSCCCRGSRPHCSSV